MRHHLLVYAYRRNVLTPQARWVREKVYEWTMDHERPSLGDELRYLRPRSERCLRHLRHWCTKERNGKATSRCHLSVCFLMRLATARLTIVAVSHLSRLLTTRYLDYSILRIVPSRTQRS
jgi:hypothetical protein